LFRKQPDHKIMGMAKVRFRLITQFFMVVAFDTFILQSMIGVYGERRGALDCKKAGGSAFSLPLCLLGPKNRKNPSRWPPAFRSRECVVGRSRRVRDNEAPAPVSTDLGDRAEH
jgi:hypothetical protein